MSLKGHCTVFDKKFQLRFFYMYIINEVKIQTYIYEKYILWKGINKLLSEDDKVPEHGLKLERWQGQYTAWNRVLL